MEKPMPDQTPTRKVQYPNAKKSDEGPRQPGKVGSDPNADRAVGGKLDFGIPASQAAAPQPIGGREKGPEQGTGPMRSGTRAVRTSGVGHAPGPDGTGSGGDLDPDFIGLDKNGGVAQTGPDERTTGPDMTDGANDPFAAGQPSAGENQIAPGAHGAASEFVTGSTIDRSGGDASTTGKDSGT
jgi:hypothetical protein